MKIKTYYAANPKICCASQLVNSKGLQGYFHSFSMALYHQGIPKMIMPKCSIVFVNAHPLTYFWKSRRCNLHAYILSRNRIRPIKLKFSLPLILDSEKDINFRKKSRWSTTTTGSAVFFNNNNKSTSMDTKNNDIKLNPRREKCKNLQLMY